MKAKNNQGFSLIELVVVIAIMGVALGILSYSLSLIQSTRSKGCADAIVSAFDLQRTNAMAKGESAGLLKITKDAASGKIMLQKGNSGTPEEIGSSSLSVTYKFKDDSTIYTLGNAPTGKELIVTFNSSSGSIIDSNCVEWIKVTGNKIYVISVAKLTGRATMTTE